MDIAQDKLIEMLRLMQSIRGFEKKAQELFKEGLAVGQFLGALHSYEGQEAVAVGVCTCLRPDDYVLSTHRGHGHFLAKGGDMKAMMAELLGKETGVSRGRGGSMHMFDPGLGLLGGNGIVGGGTPLALGPAFAAQYRGTDQVTVCFLGEGAATQGAFHESLGLASLWSLPVIYVCENNLWAATTPVSHSWPVHDLAPRAESFGMPGATVDGNDVLAVHEVAGEAVARARGGDGPTLIEAKTYRHRPHCMVIPEHREAEELEQWRRRDPIPRFERHLLDTGVMTEAEIEELRAGVDAELEAAADFARSSPLPDPAAYADYLWA
ncbi:MAG TPA: thiamine pyrophosphate-dependent enzyme [Armatimonadota bacterium]|nr:thiamine pyrophosphate-dependent enzyme [Armatimonadota bacterium]